MTEAIDYTAIWKEGKLEADKTYFVKGISGAVTAALYEQWYDRYDQPKYKSFSGIDDGDISEVLAPCDYDHFVELTEKVKELKDKVEWEIGKNQALEKQLTKAREEIKRGEKAFELMCDSNDKLFQLLKEASRRIQDFIDWSETKYDEAEDLLTRINEV